MTAINSNRAIRGPVTAVPVVAGKGVRLVADTENNRWVVEADETVLFESSNGGVTSFTTSEPIENFSEIWFYVKGGEGAETPVAKAILPMGFSDYSTNVAISYGSPYSLTGSLAITWTTRFTRSGNDFTFTSSYYGGGHDTKPTANVNNNIGWVFKVVGINRIASN